MQLTSKFLQEHPGARIAGVVAGTLVLLIAVLAIVRPDMMSMAMLHRLMSSAGL